MLRRALAINTVGTLINLLCQLASVVVISRLLRPEEIGLFSVASAFAALLVAVRDMGIGLYIVQERDLTAAKRNTALTLLAISSIGLGLALFGASGLIADTYGQAQLSPLIQLISANFLFVPWIGGVTAQLQRELAYGVVTKCSIVSTVVGSASGIAFAAGGHGPYSLAYSLLLTSISHILALSCYRPRALLWRPSLLQAREILAFGWRVLLGSVAQQSANSAPDLIIGKTLGMEPVALFNRAMAQRTLVTTHIVQIINATMLPKFAAEHREQTLTAEVYLQRNRLVTGLLISIYAMSAALAEPLVLLLFGAQWQGAVPVAQLLCLLPLISLPYSLMKIAASASGRVGSLARLELWCMAARVGAILIGAQHGLICIAALMVLEVLTYAFVLNRIGQEMVGMSSSTLYRSCSSDYLVGLLTGAAAWLTANATYSLSLAAASAHMAALLSGGTVGLGVWLIAIRRLNTPLYTELTHWQALVLKRLPAQLRRSKGA